jgi:hypothetical protein
MWIKLPWFREVNASDEVESVLSAFRNSFVFIPNDVLVAMPCVQQVEVTISVHIDRA